jgi:hypothetical protein
VAVQRNVVIECSGMPQASKRVAGRSEHGAAVRRPPDPVSPLTPHPEGVPHCKLKLNFNPSETPAVRTMGRTHWARRHLAGLWRTDARMRSAQWGLDPRAKDLSPLQRGKSPSAKQLPVRLRSQLHSIARRTGPSCNAITTERSGQIDPERKPPQDSQRIIRQLHPAGDSDSHG